MPPAKTPFLCKPVLAAGLNPVLTRCAEHFYWWHRRQLSRRGGTSGRGESWAQGPTTSRYPTPVGGLYAGPRARRHDANGDHDGARCIGSDNRTRCQSRRLCRQRWPSTSFGAGHPFRGRTYPHDGGVCNRFKGYAFSEIAPVLIDVPPANQGWFWHAHGGQGDAVQEDAFIFHIFVNEAEKQFHVDSRWIQDDYGQDLGFA